MAGVAFVVVDEDEVQRQRYVSNVLHLSIYVLNCQIYVLHLLHNVLNIYFYFILTFLNFLVLKMAVMIYEQSEAVPIAVMDDEYQEKGIVVAKNISTYTGRTDYKGRNEIPDVERSVLDTFMSRDDFG